MNQRQSPQSVAKTTPTTDFKEDNLWGKASRFLFGNDVFISYARRDTTIYSLGLASELTKNELSCFLDQWGTPSGKELPAQLVTALKRSNMLILLGTKQAAASAAVATEIRQFKKTGRTIIPVSFDGALEQAEWYQDLIAGISIAHESSDALQSGKASEHVINRIVNAENFTRRSKRLRRYFGLTAASVVMMLVAGGLVAMFIVRQANAKATEAEVRRQDADSRAKQAEVLANEAETKRKDAETEANRLNGVAKKAQEDQQAAEQKAGEAAKNEALAKANADEQRKIADEQEKRSKRLSYIGNIRFAHQMDELGRQEKVQQLLDDFEPALAGDNKQSEDLRGYEWYHLWYSSHRILATIPLTKNRFSEDTEEHPPIAISSRHQQLVTVSGGAVKVWNASNTSPSRRVVTLHKGELGSVVYSPDETILASIKQSKILLWNAETLVAMEPIKHPTGKDFLSLAFAPPGGSRLATADKDGINIWDIGQGKISKPIESIPWPSKSDELSGRYFAFSPDGTRLAAKAGHMIAVWEISSTGRAATNVATLDQKKTAKVDPNEAATEEPAPEPSQMLFLPDNQTVAILFTGDEVQDAGNFQLWDLNSQTIKSEFKINIGAKSNENQTTIVRAALSPDGQVLATGSRYDVASGGGVKLWNTVTGELLATLDGLGTSGNVAALAFSPDSKTLAIRSTVLRNDATTAQDPTEWRSITTVQLSDATTARASTELQRISGRIESMTVSPDGNLRATITRDKNKAEEDRQSKNALKFWNTKTGEVYTHPKPGVASIAFSPDGSTYATATLIQENEAASEGEGDAVTTDHWLVELWDTQSHKLLGEPLGATSDSALVFSPDGKTLATAVEHPEECEPGDACIQFWNVATREKSVSPASKKKSTDDDSQTQYSAFTPAAFSPNGKLLIAFEGYDGSSAARILDTTTKKILTRFSLSNTESYNRAFAFSQDGKTVAIGHNDSTITLWDVSSLYEKNPIASPYPWNRDSKQFIKMLDEHTGAVNFVGFSPDGKTMASASDDAMVQLWDTRFYQPLATFSDYSGPVKFMFFTPDGSALITAGPDKTGNVTVRRRQAATREEVALGSK